ncbi:MAG: hypothetical protein JWO36_5346 [Myxococcales bacterium]|nr:hypothetical protein [Myxococcales bacterium]
MVAVAKQMVQNVPAPAASHDCKPEELTGATLTNITLRRIAGLTNAADPEHAEWINPSELETSAARVLADPKADAVAARRAAAELLAAPGFVVYRIDIVNAPIALEVKDLKLGTVGARAIHYDKTGEPTCVLYFTFANDKAKSDWAIGKSDRAIIDPVVAKAMREDLKEQYLKSYPRPPRP